MFQVVLGGSAEANSVVHVAQVCPTMYSGAVQLNFTLSEDTLFEIAMCKVRSVGGMLAMLGPTHTQRTKSRGRQAKVGPRGKVGHPHHSKYGEGYDKNNDASF